MNFVKMHGAGNDYIFVDCSVMTVSDMSAAAVEMSDRHYGIGGDGVVFMYPSAVADVRMRMFNADGSEGSMCGNAVRCIGRLFMEKCGCNECSVETKSGIKVVTKRGDEYTVNMGEPTFGGEMPISVNGTDLSCVYVSVGNPHCVIFSDGIDNADMSIGESLQSHPLFPGGINVEFVEGSGSLIKMRVFERGSGETLSCGSGACASVVACVLKGKCKKGTEVSVLTKGGVLKVNYDSDIFLTGNADKIYEGEYYDKIHFCDGRRCQRTR